MDPTTDEPADLPLDSEIAERLGLGVAEFRRLAGRDWYRVPVEDDLDVAWYKSGQPPQVLLGLPWTGTHVLVAKPEGRWRYGMTYTPAEQPTLVTDLHSGLTEAISAACQSRRKAFRWCRYCRQITAPEDRFEADTCSGCAEVVLGVVH